MIKISAVIIAYNEEKTLPRCLSSVLWADEIVVVDSDSTDQTPVICKDPNAPWAGKMSFFNRPWTGFRDQRNFALQSSKHDWVFVIDADEACSEALAAEIHNLTKDREGPALDAYKIRRQEYFLGKAVHHGIWNPSYQDRFFKRTGVEYINEVHEYPVFKNPPGRIHSPIDHWPDFNPEKFLGKMNRYTTIEARDRVKAGMRTNAFRLFFAFPAMFLKNYFYYGAYKDGYHGFIISLLEGLSRVVRHVKIWQMSNLKK